VEFRAGLAERTDVSDADKDAGFAHDARVPYRAAPGK
jgi:hypothetical protein